MALNKLDIIILIPLLWGLYSGFRRGFIIEAASFVSLIIATWGAVKFSGYVSEVLTEKYDFQTEFLPAVSFLLVFLLVVIGIHLLARIIQGILKLAMLGMVNRLFGALFSCLKFAVIVSVMIFGITSIIDEEDLISEEEKAGTYLYQHVSKLSYTLVPALKEQVTDLKEKYKDQFDPEKLIQDQLMD